MKTKPRRASLVLAALCLAAGDLSGSERFSAAYANLPITFEANVGQADAGVEFLAHGPNGNLLLTRSEAWLTLRRNSKDGEPLRRIGLSVRGGNPNPRLEGLDPLPGKANYFAGNDPRRWHINAATFSKVK